MGRAGGDGTGGVPGSALTQGFPGRARSAGAEQRQQFLGELVAPAFPDKMSGGLRRPPPVLEAGTPLESQRRAYQTHAARLRRRRVIKPPVFRQHHQTLRLERHGQALAAAAVGEELALAGTRQELGEDDGTIVATEEIPLPAAEREEREFGLVTPAPVWLQPLEEEGEEAYVCRDRRMDVGSLLPGN